LLQLRLRGGLGKACCRLVSPPQLKQQIHLAGQDRPPICKAVRASALAASVMPCSWRRRLRKASTSAASG
jgi:hypothetical protein